VQTVTLINSLFNSTDPFSGKHESSQLSKLFSHFRLLIRPLIIAAGALTPAAGLPTIFEDERDTGRFELRSHRCELSILSDVYSLAKGGNDGVVHNGLGKGSITRITAYDQHCSRVGK
jgi:hypothetical protein